MSKVSMAYIVPTKDRPLDLEKLLVSLSKQTLLPQQIIIVDGSKKPITSVIEEFDNLNITYVREYPPSLARQRNSGMRALRTNINIAGYLDDDIELEPDATEKMYKFWSNAPQNVGGASFTIVNQPLRSSVFGLLSAFFLLNNKTQGAVLSSGFATSIVPRDRNTKTDWLYGGATMWRREVIKKFDYDEWYIGHGYLEDLDYSYRVGQGYDLWVLCDAKLSHYPSDVISTRNISLGRQEIVNRVYFVKKMRTFKTLHVGWALFGQMIRNGLESVVRVNLNGIYRLLGNIWGLLDLLRYGTKSIDGIWK